MDPPWPWVGTPLVEGCLSGHPHSSVTSLLPLAPQLTLTPTTVASFLVSEETHMVCPWVCWDHSLSYPYAS